jgi:hypothetical protein
MVSGSHAHGESEEDDVGLRKIARIAGEQLPTQPVALSGSSKGGRGPVCNPGDSCVPPRNQNRNVNVERHGARSDDADGLAPTGSPRRRNHRVPAAKTL